MDLELIKNKLPENLGSRFENPLLKAAAWSEEWEKEAKEIIMELNKIRDKGVITPEERNYIHATVFHSVGKIGNPTDSDFFRFYIGAKDDK